MYQYHTIEEAEKELHIAREMNPGPWVGHSVNVGIAAKVLFFGIYCFEEFFPSTAIINPNKGKFKGNKEIDTGEYVVFWTVGAGTIYYINIKRRNGNWNLNY